MKLSRCGSVSSDWFPTKDRLADVGVPPLGLVALMVALMLFAVACRSASVSPAGKGIPIAVDATHESPPAGCGYSVRLIRATLPLLVKKRFMAAFSSLIRVQDPEHGTAWLMEPDL